MKTICKLKFADLNKSNIEKRDMSRLYGGHYCYYDEENHTANSGADKCSCVCESQDYYNGLNTEASYWKYTNHFTQDQSC